MTATDSATDVRVFLARHRLSQAALAELLGVSRATVEFWCQGRTQPPPYLWRALRDLSAHELAPQPEGAVRD